MQNELIELEIGTMFEIVMNMIRAIRVKARLKVTRTFNDFFADRIIQASNEPTLIAMVEKLSQSVDADTTEIYKDTRTDFMKASQSLNAPVILNWIRNYPKVTAMIVSLPHEEMIDAIKPIQLGGSLPPSGGYISDTIRYEIPIRVECLSPLSHGGDTKAGNATIFRRCQILSTVGSVLSLPFYGGNALRGKMRDLLADHFSKALGLEPRRDKPPYNLWFFYALYCGGALESKANAISKEIGDRALKPEGIYQLRDTLPALSLLGAALGNRIISGRVNFGDLRPRCKEWGTGELDSATLMEWTFLTRHEDLENYQDGEHHGMIANTETLKAGTVLDGGIDMDNHISDLEKSALGMGLKLLQDEGYLGANNRQGLGKVKIEIENMPDPSLYEEYLKKNQSSVLDYLESVDAIKCTL